MNNETIQQVKLCNTIHETLNGGIWRLKWYPTTSHQSYKLLIGAMHGGCYVYDCTNCWRDQQKQQDTTIPINNNNNKNNKNNIVSNYNSNNSQEEEIVNQDTQYQHPHRMNEFHKHDSMVYGIDWLMQNNCNKNTQHTTNSNSNGHQKQDCDNMNHNTKEKEELWNAAVRYVIKFLFFLL